MAQRIVIAESSYLMKRGISAVISDIVQAEIVFVNGMDELNHYLETNLVDYVFVDEELLNNREEREFFFQLQEKTIYIALSENPKNFPGSNNFFALIDKKSPKENLIPLLEETLENKPYAKNNKDSILSERETEVLKQVALGYTNQQIAERLFISKHTVISHRKNITSKLGIKSVSGLTVYAVLNNLIPKDQI
ncbi:MAG: LuxR C-terminal-related transcriptional regulator [Bacteroidales bacterium]|nr:LuxR C-terminal-related transcriptional regulator [Bacteroidales bacterium]